MSHISYFFGKMYVLTGGYVTSLSSGGNNAHSIRVDINRDSFNKNQKIGFF